MDAHRPTWHAWRHAVERLPWTEGQRRVLAGRLPLAAAGHTLQEVAGTQLSRARVHQIETEVRKRLKDSGELEVLQQAFLERMSSGQPMILEHWSQTPGFWAHVPVPTIATALRYDHLSLTGWRVWRALQEWNARHMVVPLPREQWDQAVHQGRKRLEQVLQWGRGVSRREVGMLLSSWVPRPDSSPRSHPGLSDGGTLPAWDEVALAGAVEATYLAAVVAPMIVAKTPPATPDDPWILGSDLSASQVLLATLRAQGGQASVGHILRSIRQLENPAGQPVETAEITLRTRLTAGVRDGVLERIAQGHYRLAARPGSEEAEHRTNDRELPHSALSRPTAQAS